MKFIVSKKINNGHNTIYYDGDKIWFDKNYYVFTGLHSCTNCKLRVCEVVSIPYIDKYGLHSFGNTLKKASQYIPVRFVDDPAKADIIHLHQVGPINIPPEFEDKKIILHFHGFVPQNFEKYKDTVNKLVFISNYQKNIIFGCKKGHIIYNAIEPHPKLQKKRIYHFMFAQSDFDEKNPEWIKNNAKTFQEYKIAIAGKINVSSDNVTNYGYLPIPQLHNLHAQSHIFVLPSKKEAFGLAPLYAMLQGAIPAVSIYSGIAEILPEELSIHFDPFNTTLGDIWRIFKDRHLYYKRRAVRKFALQFSPQKWARDITNIFSTID